MGKWKLKEMEIAFGTLKRNAGLGLKRI